MANPQRLLGILIALAVVGSGSYFAWRKVEAANAKKKADSTATAGGKAASIPRPDSAGRVFDAGAAIPVVGAPVVRGPLIVWVSANGEAASSQQVVVGAEAGGRVERVFHKESDMVKVGDTLVVLDTTELVFALKSARNSLQKANFNYQNALISDHLITDPQIRKQRADAAMASSGVVEAQLSLDRAQLEYSKATTRAPSSGRIANLKVVPGQRVGAGTEVMTVVAMDPIRIHAQVLQDEVSQLKVGNAARVEFPAIDSILVGKIESINFLVDASARTARVTVVLPNPRGEIIPGMSARVQLQSRTYENRLLVPRASILQRSGERDMLFVYTPNKDGPDGRTDWRYVNLGLRNSEFIEIIPGIDGSQKMVEPGEMVIIAGHYTLEHMSLVKLVDKLTGITR